MKGLTKEDVLGADDIIIQEVQTPEWGGSVFIRTLTAAENFKFSRSNVDPDGNIVEGNIIVKYCALVICSEGGSLLFEEADVEALARKSTVVLIRIYEKGKILNGEDVEGIAKNSETIQSDGSISD